MAVALPSVVLIITIAICLFAYKGAQAFWHDFLDASPTARALFHICLFGLALFGGAWADLLSMGEIADGNISDGQLKLLCLYAFGVPTWVCFVLIAHSREDARESKHSAATAAAKMELEAANRKLEEAECQKKYLASLLQHFRYSITAYARMIRTTMEDPGGYQMVDAADWLAPGSQVASLVIDGARVAIKAVLPNATDARVVTALFVEKDGYLTPEYSYDGAQTDLIESEFSKYKTFFNLDEPNASVAVVSAKEDVIHIVEDTAEAHLDESHPFKYFPGEKKQRDTVKSLICIPLVYDGAPGKVVLCLSCDRANAFKQSHKWKIEQARLHLQARLELLAHQSLLLEGIRSAEQQKLSTIENQYRQANEKQLRRIKKGGS